MSNDNDSNKETEKMDRYSFRMPPSLLKQAKQKAGLIPLSKIIRLLIEKWIAGEVKVDDR